MGLIFYLICVIINLFFINFTIVHRPTYHDGDRWEKINAYEPGIYFFGLMPTAPVVTIFLIIEIFINNHKNYKIVFPYRITWKD